MLWRCSLVIVVLLVIAPTASFSQDISRFAVVSDSRAGGRTSQCAAENYGVSPVLSLFVSDMLERHKTSPIKLLLFPGDLMSGYLQRDQPSVADCNRIQIRHWRKTVKPLLDNGIKIRVTVGNHDVATLPDSMRHIRCGRYVDPYVPAAENFTVLQEELADMLEGKPGPNADEGMSYSLDAGGCHFVSLAAYTMHQHNAFSDETLQWLENDLKEARTKGTPIFVMAHPPAFPGGGHMWDSLPSYDPTYSCDDYSGIDRRKERDRFWNILKKYKVVAYFCGHEHNTQVQLVEGVWHVVAGGATLEQNQLNGAPTDTTARNRILYDGEFQNPRAQVIWPWEEKGKRLAYYGWFLITIQGQKITMDLYGTDQRPCTGDQPESCAGAALRPLLKEPFVLRDVHAD